MINIFISSLIGSIVIISNGYLFHSLIFKKKLNDFNIYKDSFLGFILIGFICLLVNFFLPINKSISSIFLIFSVLIFVYFFINFNKKNKLLWVLLYLAIITFIIITYLKSSCIVLNIFLPISQESFNIEYKVSLL